MKRVLDLGDRVPFTMELMPSRMPSEEFTAAIKVIEDSQDVEALKNAFTTLRCIVIYNLSLVTSSPSVVSSLFDRIKRYIASESNFLLTIHACRTLIDMIQTIPKSMYNYSQEIIKLTFDKYMKYVSVFSHQ